MITLIATTLLFQSLYLDLPAGSHRLEADYQNVTCPSGPIGIEWVLHDKTRVDCLTDTHAIEHDFAKKWPEALGQSLHYARLTGKKPGIVLILQKESDIRYYYRLMNVLVHNNIKIDVALIKAYE